MALMGDNWDQDSFDVTAAAQDLWSYAASEAKDPVDILVQNNHATAIVYVNLSGDATVSTTMFMVRGGGSVMRFTNVRNSVSVIGSVASNIVPYSIVKGGNR